MQKEDQTSFFNPKLVIHPHFCAQLSNNAAFLVRAISVPSAMFIATLKRFGGSVYKAPRNPGRMAAVPPTTSAVNMSYVIVVLLLHHETHHEHRREQQ